jgi:hypothetical protein
VKDLAVAMANVIGKKAAIGKIYNVQDAQSVTFEGLAKLCVHARGSPLFTHALSSAHTYLYFCPLWSSYPSLQNPEPLAHTPP